MANRQVRDDYGRRPGVIQNKKKAAVLIIIIVVAVTGISLTAVSFESVDYNEYGLLQNTLTREIEETVYEAGFYYTGLFASFIKFDNTWQTIEFSPSDDADDIPVVASTNDGFQIVIDTSFQFRVQKDLLLSLYSAHGLNYRAFYIQEARSSIRNVAAQFNASEFYTNRLTIDDAFRADLNNKSALFMAQIGEFQLRQVDLPTNIDTALQEIFLAQLQLEIADLAQQEAVINAQTAIIQAYALANTTIIEAESLATALNITLTAEGAALFEVANQTGFNTTELLMYLWIKAVEGHDSSHLISPGDTPFIFDFGT